MEYPRKLLELRHVSTQLVLTIIHDESESPREQRHEWYASRLDNKVVEDLGSPDGPPPSLPDPLLHLLLDDPPRSRTRNQRRRNADNPEPPFADTHPTDEGDDVVHLVGGVDEVPGDAERAGEGEDGHAVDVHRDEGAHHQEGAHNACDTSDEARSIQVPVV